MRLPFQFWCRVATAVRKELASPADCVKFLMSHHEDDQEAKKALLLEIADPTKLCNLCSPPKAWLFPMLFYYITFCMRY
jgi:hypothetical protein